MCCCAAGTDDESLGSEAKFSLIAMLPASVMCCLSMGIVASENVHETRSNEDVALQSALKGTRGTWRSPGKRANWAYCCWHARGQSVWEVSPTPATQIEPCVSTQSNSGKKILSKQKDLGFYLGILL